MSAGEITVTRPDPETGEKIEETVDAAHFDRKLPTRPEKDDPEETANYWEAHASILTREERQSIVNGKSHIVRPAEFPPAWKKGDVLEVATNLTAEVLDETRTLKGIATKLRVVDLRPLMMKQTVGGGGRPRTDAHGYPAPLTPGEQERARIDGAYTRNPALAVPDSGEVMDDKLHQRLHAEAAMKTALEGSRRRIRADKMNLERRLADARTKHQRSTIRVLERKLKAAEKHDENAGA